MKWNSIFELPNGHTKLKFHKTNPAYNPNNIKIHAIYTSYRVSMGKHSRLVFQKKRFW